MPYSHPTLLLVLQWLAMPMAILFIIGVGANIAAYLGADAERFWSWSKASWPKRQRLS